MIENTSYGITSMICNTCGEILFRVEKLKYEKEIDLGNGVKLITELDLNSYAHFNMICKCKNCGNEFELNT